MAIGLRKFGERTSGRSPSGYRQKGPLTRKAADDFGFRKVFGAWTGFEKNIAKAIMAVFDSVGYNILFDAVNACPYETGMLRRSARANVIMGYGQSPKNILYVPEADDTGYFVIKSRPITQQNAMAEHFKRKGGRRMRLIYSFTRVNEKGQNIAVWTHEELLPHSSRKRRGKYEEETRRSPIYFATKRGTGPKYLEDAIKKYHMELRSALNSIVRMTARQASRIIADEKRMRIREAERQVDRAVKPVIERQRRQRKTIADIRRDVGLAPGLRPTRVKRRVPRRYITRVPGWGKK